MFQFDDLSINALAILDANFSSMEKHNSSDLECDDYSHESMTEDHIWSYFCWLHYDDLFLMSDDGCQSEDYE
jgi:hypothetical protein